MLPEEIVVCDQQSIRVEQVDGLPEFGHWDEESQVVRIRSDLDDPAKLVVLMHEMIHMAETQLIEARVLGWFYRIFIRRIWGEQLVEHLSSFLFQWMARSGMLTGITPGEAKAWIDRHLDEYPEAAVVL